MAAEQDRAAKQCRARSECRAESASPDGGAYLPDVETERALPAPDCAWFARVHVDAAGRARVSADFGFLDDSPGSGPVGY